VQNKNMNTETCTKQAKFHSSSILAQVCFYNMTLKSLCPFGIPLTVHVNFTIIKVCLYRTRTRLGGIGPNKTN